jgi:hypothetical protein
MNGGSAKSRWLLAGLLAACTLLSPAIAGLLTTCILRKTSISSL